MPPVTGQRPMVGVNWKMHLTPTEAAVYLDTFRELVADVDDRDIFVLPAYPALQTARDRLRGSNVAWGAQDVHPDEPGPHTGDVSAAMLADLGCRFVMVGHTERRRDHGEDYDLVGAKVAAVARHAMVPIICIGEQEPVGPDGGARRASCPTSIGPRPGSTRPTRPRSWSPTSPAGPSDRAWSRHHPR